MIHPARPRPVVGGDAVHYSGADLRVWGTTSQINKEIEMARLIGTGTHPGYPEGHDFDVPTEREKEEYLSDGRGVVPDEAYWDRVHGVDEKQRELELALAPPEDKQLTHAAAYNDPTSSEWAGGEDAARVKASARLGHAPAEAGLVNVAPAADDAKTTDVDETGDRQKANVEVKGDDKAASASHAEKGRSK